MECLVEVTMKSGHVSSVFVPGDAVISGETLLGSFTIPINKIHQIICQS